MWAPGIAEAELKHGHARNLRRSRRAFDLRRDVAEVLGEEGQAAEGFAQLDENVVLGTVDPMAVDRGGLAGGNLPELLEAAEVVEANVVAVLRGPTQALHPPLVALGAHDVPVVERVSPALAGLAEEVRRNAGHDLGLKVFVEAEQVRVGPDVGAIEVHEDGDIADHAYRALFAVVAERPPLLVEGELYSAADGEIVREFPPCFFERRGFATGQLAWPLVPGLQLEAGAQCVEENEVVEPPRYFVRGTESKRWRASLEPDFTKLRAASNEQRQLAAEEPAHIRRDRPRSGKVEIRPWRDPAAIDQPLQAD